MRHFIIIPVFCVLLPTLINALSYIGNDERYQCETFPVQKGINESWMASVDKWYIPLWNKVEFYHNAEAMYGKEKFGQLTNKDLEKTCATYTADADNNVTFTAFGDKQVEYHTYPDPLREGIYYWSAPNNAQNATEKTENYQYVATSYNTFSDNATYIVTVCLWSDGRKGFTVSSTTPTMEPKSLREVKQHLLKLGFLVIHFVQFNYDKCGA